MADTRKARFEDLNVVVQQINVDGRAAACQGMHIRANEVEANALASKLRTEGYEVMVTNASSFYPTEYRGVHFSNPKGPTKADVVITTGETDGNGKLVQGSHKPYPQIVTETESLEVDNG